MPSVVSRSQLLTFAAVAATAMASLALVACEEQRRLPDYVAVALNDTTMRHPIGFDDRSEVLNIDLPPRATSLSHNQVADMQRFVARYKAEGVGRLGVSVASQARGSAGATHALDDLGRILKDAGVPSSQVVKSRHSDVHRTRAMVRLSFVRPTAVPPECGHWHRDIGRERERYHYPEFGCSTQRNLAGMVANARDLQRPQDEQPRSAERRSQSWSKYIAPEMAETTAETKAKAVETTKKQ
jgi:pilus assembly protein CpaD